MRYGLLIATMLLSVGLAACQVPGEPTPSVAGARPGATDAAALTPVTLMLDWVPNTNHTGIFVAQEQGYFEESGLEVRIIQPGEVMAPQAVLSGAADFGVDFQEQLTIARAEGLPIVSIAAVMQHNTSGFAARSDLGVSSPRDWEGLRYGAFGSPFEEPTLRALMTCDGGDYAALETVNVGFADPLALLAEEQTDLAWIFYGWQGIQAEIEGVALDVVMMSDHFDCVPDYYTPILVTSEETIAGRPDVARAFVSAVARGYADAVEDPEAAAGALLRAAPELDPELVYRSQEWVSPRYRAEAARWGLQSRDVWEAYASWMVDAGVIGEIIDVDQAFTNAFLPGE